MSNGAGDAVPEEEYDIEIDFSSFTHNIITKDENADDKELLSSIQGGNGAEQTTEKNASTGGTGVEAPPPPPRPSSNTPVGMNENDVNSPPQPVVDSTAQMSPTPSSNSSHRRRSSKSASEWRKEASRRNSDRVLPPPSSIRSDSISSRTRRSTMSPLLRGAPKPPLPQEPLRRSKSAGSEASNDDENMESQTPGSSSSLAQNGATVGLTEARLEATPEESSPVLMPTVSTTPKTAYEHLPENSQREPENESVKDFRRLAIGNNESSNGQTEAPHVHAVQASYDSPGGKHVSGWDDHTSFSRPASMSTDSGKLSASGPHSPQSPGGSESGGHSSHTPRVAQRESRMDKWHRARNEKIERLRRMKEKQEEEEQCSFRPNLQLTEEANNKLVMHDQAPWKRLRTWGKMKRAEMEDKRRKEERERQKQEEKYRNPKGGKEKAPKQEENNATGRVEPQGEVATPQSARDHVEYSGTSAKSDNRATSKKKQKKKQNVSPQLKERQKAQLEAFLERQKKAREQQEDKKRVPFTTGENYTGKITKPKEFKLSYYNRQSDLEKERKERDSKEGSKPRSTNRNAGAKEGPPPLNTAQRKQKGPTGQKKVSSPPSNSGAAWARFANEVPVSLSADPEFIEGTPAGISAVSNEDVFDAKFRVKEPSNMFSNVMQEQSGPGMSKRVAFAEGSVQKPVNPLSASQSEKLEKRPPTPHPSQSGSFAPPTPAPPRQTGSSSHQRPEGSSTYQEPESSHMTTQKPASASNTGPHSVSQSTEDEEASLETLREEIRRVREELQREKEGGDE